MNADVFWWKFCVWISGAGWKGVIVKPVYSVAKREGLPGSEPAWGSGRWKGVRALEIGRGHPATRRHRPRAEVKAAHTSDAVHLLFRVSDRFVSCQNTELHSGVWHDSCVEAFLMPVEGKGYFNFELNCGGT